MTEKHAPRESLGRPLLHPSNPHSALFVGAISFSLFNELSSERKGRFRHRQSERKEKTQNQKRTVRNYLTFEER